jgi:DNA invertase Pin-like site-specific DNA recombinase
MRKVRQAVTSGAPVRALLYIRVSSDEQEREGLSLAAQLAAVRHYAAEHGWLIVGEYQDVLSGKRDDRPGYQQLLADVRARRSTGEAVLVVVRWLHRFGRRVSERVRAWEELDSLNVAIHSVSEGGQVSKLMHDILASVAEEELRQLSDRVSSTWEHIRAQGWAMVGKCPFGYRWRERTDVEKVQGAPALVLDVDPEAAACVRSAFERVAEGEATRSVARGLSTLPEAVRGPRLLTLRTVQHILRNPLYAGIAADGSTGRWPALIPPELFAAVQARIDQHQAVPRNASREYLLTGFARCPACGERMQGSVTPSLLAGGSKSGKRIRRYRCQGSPHRTAATCHQTADATKIDGLVLDELRLLFRAALHRNRAAFERAWERQRQTRPHTTNMHRESLDRAVAKLQQRLVNAGNQFADGDMPKERYQELLAANEPELQRLEAELRGLPTPVAAPVFPAFALALRSAEVWTNVVDGDQLAAQRDVLAALVATVTPRRIAHGVYAVECTWTPLGEGLRSALGLGVPSAA